MLKKSQLISLIIILTLLVFISLCFLIYIRYKLVVPPDTRQIVKEKEIIGVVREQIEGCLRVSATDSLQLIGLQGGKIYESQSPGTAPLIWPPAGLYVIPFDGSNVSFGIFAPKTEIPPPEHPYPGALKVAEGFFGRNVLTPLCDNQGPNAWDSQYLSRSCINYDTVNSPHSIQEYLQNFILNKTLKCLNLTELGEYYNVNLTLGESSVVVVVRDIDVSTLLNSEIKVQAGGMIEQKIDNLSVSVPVRLKKIYELAYAVVEADISDPYFDVRDNDSLALLNNCPTPDRKSFDQPCLKPGMDVSVVEDVCKDTCVYSRYANIIRIRDNNTIVNGMPYIFQFAMENRRPALEWIDESGGDRYNAYLITTYGKSLKDYYQKTLESLYNEKYNIVVTAGLDIPIDIHIMPLGLDPDADTLTYSYSGWKTPHIIDKEYRDPFVRDPVIYHGGDSGYNEWEDSGYYGNNQKDADYTPGPDDVGYHIVRVSVSDSEGLADWQDVRILVNDRPFITSWDVTGCNPTTFNIQCDDMYHSNYTLEIFDEDNDFVKKQSSTCDFYVDDVIIGGYTTLTIRVTDDFGAYDKIDDVDVCE